MRAIYVVLTILVTAVPLIVPTAGAVGVTGVDTALSLREISPFFGLATLAWALLGLRLVRT